MIHSAKFKLMDKCKFTGKWTLYISAYGKHGNELEKWLHFRNRALARKVMKELKACDLHSLSLLWYDKPFVEYYLPLGYDKKNLRLPLY